MKKPKIKVIKTIKESPCACCFRGEKPDKKCKSCNGSGIYKDWYYFMIINNKICYGMDTLK